MTTERISPGHRALCMHAASTASLQACEDHLYNREHGAELA